MDPCKEPLDIELKAQNPVAYLVIGNHFIIVHPYYPVYP